MAGEDARGFVDLCLSLGEGCLALVSLPILQFFPFSQTLPTPARPTPFRIILFSLSKAANFADIWWRDISTENWKPKIENGIMGLLANFI